MFLPAIVLALSASTATFAQSSWDVEQFEGHDIVVEKSTPWEQSSVSSDGKVRTKLTCVPSKRGIGPIALSMGDRSHFLVMYRSDDYFTIHGSGGLADSIVCQKQTLQAGDTLLWGRTYLFHEVTTPTFDEVLDAGFFRMQPQVGNSVDDGDSPEGDTDSSGSISEVSSAVEG